MREEISVRQWQEQFKAGFYDSPDIHTQCGAGWYDWFCQDKASQFRHHLWHIRIRIGSTPAYTSF